jgi:hypothetical protein
VVCGRQVVIHGGYSTSLSIKENDNQIANYAYLGDTFVYDMDTKAWRTVVAKEFPPSRASANLVHVAACEAPGPGHTAHNSPFVDPVVSSSILQGELYSFSLSS